MLVEEVPDLAAGSSSSEISAREEVLATQANRDLKLLVKYESVALIQEKLSSAISARFQDEAEEPARSDIDIDELLSLLASEKKMESAQAGPPPSEPNAPPVGPAPPPQPLPPAALPSSSRRELALYRRTMLNFIQPATHESQSAKSSINVALQFKRLFPNHCFMFLAGDQSTHHHMQCAMELCEDLKVRCLDSVLTRSPFFLSQFPAVK